jgi:spore germination protein KB
MKKEQISTAVLTFSIGCFMQSSTLLVGFVTATTKQESWIPVLAGIVLTLPLIWIYFKIADKYPGKSIIEIDDLVFGKVIGKFFSVVYILFFISLSALNATIIADFLVSSVLPETPKLAGLILFMLLCAYALSKGIETITRCSTLFTFIIIIVVVVNGILMSKNMKADNFLPVFSLPLKKYIQATQTEVFLPFGEIFVFFMLFPNMQNPKDMKKSFMRGYMIGTGTMLMIMLRDISVLGPTIGLVTIPAYESVRLINVANILTRMEFFYATLLIVLSFFKVSILYYASTKAVTELVGMSSYKCLLRVMGVLIVIFTLINFKSANEHAAWGVSASSFYSSFFILILPLITLITIAIKGFFKNEA